MREIELVRQSTDEIVCIPENFETVVKICVEKLKNENYHTLRIYREFKFCEMHDDFVYILTNEVIWWYKQNVFIRRKSSIMFNFHRMMINRIIATIQTSINLWMMYLIMAITVPSANILQYTYYKKHMYLDATGALTMVKPMEPKFTYRMPNDSPKYIHHPMKLDISSKYGEMKR